MPGKIIQVLKTIGEKVLPGDGLVILEAMKMENEMRSEIEGKITEIFVQPGQKVETGALILKISCT
jgi:biotin carboxyl carrier protein